MVYLLLPISMNEKNEKPEVKGYIILDTNILIKLGENSNKKSSQLSTKIFEHLNHIISENPGWYLAISAITLYELINQTTVETELAREQMLQGVKCFPISLPVIRIAARLSCFYKLHNISDDQIELPDKLISATSMQTGAVIFTTNASDYPSPFFSEHRPYRLIVEHSNKYGYPNFVPVYMMIPERLTLKSYYNGRISPLKKKKGRK